MRKHLFKGLCAVTCALVVLTSACVHRQTPGPDAQVPSPLEELREVIRRTVKDPVRAARIEKLAEQADCQAGELSWFSHEFRDQLRALNANYNAKPKEFKNLIADFKLQRQRLRDGIIDLLFRIRKLATEQEWKELSGFERRALSQRLLDETVG